MVQALVEKGLERPKCDWIADALVALHGQAFGGKRGGKYRVSRKFLRQLIGRRRLAPELLMGVANELFERGYVLIDLETHFVVLNQKGFDSTRRLTAAAVARVLCSEVNRPSANEEPAPNKGSSPIGLQLQTSEAKLGNP